MSIYDLKDYLFSVVPFLYLYILYIMQKRNISIQPIDESVDRFVFSDDRWMFSNFFRCLTIILGVVIFICYQLSPKSTCQITADKFIPFFWPTMYVANLLFLYFGADYITSRLVGNNIIFENNAILIKKGRLNIKLEFGEVKIDKFKWGYEIKNINEKVVFRHSLLIFYNNYSSLVYKLDKLVGMSVVV